MEVNKEIISIVGDKLSMNDNMKDKIRPIYEELIGYLSQVPVPENPYIEIFDESYWDLLGQTIDELNQITNKNYNKFRIAPEREGSSINLGAYRTNLNGLILRLHAEYYPNEPTPFSGAPPTTIISQEQSQSQEQSVQVVMLLEIQEKIITKLQYEEISHEERGFLERVKDGLTGVKNVVGLINLILSTAQQMGVTLNNLVNLFK